MTTNIQVITDIDTYRDMIDILSRASVISFDTETTGLDPYQYNRLLISLYDGSTAYVIDLTKLDNKLIKELKPILENENIVKIAHNATFDYKFFWHTYRIDIKNIHDTMIVERMLYAGLRMKHTLKDVVLRRLDIDMDKSVRASFIDMNIEDVTFTEEQYTYSAMDVVYPYQIYSAQLTEIAAQKLERIYALEMSILAPTAIMEYTGVYINKSMLEALIQPFEYFVATADKALQDMLIKFGAADQIVFSRDGYQAINTASTDQMKQALLRIGIKIESKGKLSLDSKAVQRWDMQQRKKSKKVYKDFDIDYHVLIDDETVADALEAYLGLDNPVLRAFTFLQGARKLLGTYIYGLLDAINPVTGRIHPYFNSYGAEATGRYSSNGPNFQNLPNDKKLAILGLGQYSLRKCLESVKGRKFIIADYSGIELVILAANSGDKNLMNKILRGDIHTDVTKEVLSYTEITKENKKKEPHKLWRDAAKTLSYAIAYGSTGRNISETLNIMLASQGYKIDADQGDILLSNWYKLFPDTYNYLQSNAEKAIKLGYVADTWGRRRHWDKSWFLDKWRKLAAMREGQNSPIQSSSANMTKQAIALLWGRLDKTKARIIICVHDEIVVESLTSYSDTAAQIIKECMEQSIKDVLPTISQDVGCFEGTSVQTNISDRYDK